MSFGPNSGSTATAKRTPDRAGSTPPAGDPCNPTGTDSTGSGQQNIENHHTIPQQVQKLLPARVLKSKKSNDNYKGNIKAVDKNDHRNRIHDRKGCKNPGGRFNERWFEEIDKSGGIKKMTVKKTMSIRDLLTKEFGL